MRLFLKCFVAALARLFRCKLPHEGLTAVEYEAVCLIAYEGREAYDRAREQASYCHERGSEQGFQFWSQVATEIERRSGRTPLGRATASPR